MTDLELVIVLYGIIKYPVEFREQCENEIKRRTKAEGRQNFINAPQDLSRTNNKKESR
jgi:hypothetical protein